MFRSANTHVLGFGVIWSDLGLLSGANTSNPRFTGAHATAEYSALFADRHFTANGVGLPPSGGFSQGANAGLFRGHYLQAILKYKLSQHASAHLWGEFMWMGDYYQKRDMMSFLRAEVLRRWNDFVGADQVSRFISSGASTFRTRPSVTKMPPLPGSMVTVSGRPFATGSGRSESAASESCCSSFRSTSGAMRRLSAYSVG